MHTHAPYQLHPRNLSINFPILKKIIGIGFPSALQQVLTCFSNVYVQSYVNAFGSSCMAGWSACNKTDSFIMLPVSSLSMAITTFVGQNTGADKPERAREGVRTSMYLSVGVTLALTILVNIFARQILSLFTQEADVLKYGILFVLSLIHI